jgi:hypothetical protein
VELRKREKEKSNRSVSEKGKSWDKWDILYLGVRNDVHFCCGKKQWLETRTAEFWVSESVSNCIIRDSNLVASTPEGFESNWNREDCMRSTQYQLGNWEPSQNLTEASKFNASLMQTKRPMLQTLHVSFILSGRKKENKISIRTFIREEKREGNWNFLNLSLPRKCHKCSHFQMLTWKSRYYWGFLHGKENTYKHRLKQKSDNYVKYPTQWT